MPNTTRKKTGRQSTSNTQPKKPSGEYRNLRLMKGRDDLWEFEVKTKNGWLLLTNLGGEDDAIRKEFAQKTADGWIKK